MKTPKKLPTAEALRDGAGAKAGGSNNTDYTADGEKNGERRLVLRRAGELVPLEETGVAVLDNLRPPPPVRHMTLAEMNHENLGEMVRGLDEARGKYESLSGTCAILAGLVCIEAKERAAHGEYLPWLKTHLGKSHTTAGQYTAIAKEFLKLQPTLQFGQMTLALMDGAQSLAGESLDMTHPMVSAVAGWTKGRTFYELRQEFGHKAGGANSGKAKKLTSAERLALFEEAARADFFAIAPAVAKLGEKYRLREQVEIETHRDTLREHLAKVDAYLKTPPSKRERPSVESFFSAEEKGDK